MNHRPTLACVLVLALVVGVVHAAPNVANPIEILSTGFEAEDGWDLGHSICGEEFALGLTCFYPVVNVCIPKHHAASQNCCPADPNENTGWHMSPSSRHCSYPLITDAHPFEGSQHMRFAYDPDGGNPPGCQGFGQACRQRAITPQAPLTEVSRTVWSYEIAISEYLGSSLAVITGQNVGNIDFDPHLTSNTLFYYNGGIYTYDLFSGGYYVFGGWWSDNSPDYANFTIDFDPCHNVVTYSYDGVVFFEDEYAFTPPYGAGPDVDRAPTTDTAFFTSDHQVETTIDIDNHFVTHIPCEDACCDGNTGVCTDGVAAGDCSGTGLHYYPNLPCSFLGTPGYPPACAIDTGSCCDTSPGAGGPEAAGSCTNGVLESACSDVQQVWVRGGSCTDVAGVCKVGRGACGGATGCSTYPFVGQPCTVDSDCDVQGFCYPGSCANDSATGCEDKSDCAGTCVILVVNRGGALCTSNADCSITASVCLETRGACCDLLNGICFDEVLLGECGGAQRRWTQGANCFQVVCDAAPGACCDGDAFGACTQTTSAGCLCTRCEWYKEQSCDEIECTHDAIPTVSEWGLVILTLLLLTGAKVFFGAGMIVGRRFRRVP